MRRILLILTLSLLYISTYAQIAIVTSYSVAVGGSGGTSASGNTTGANLLVAVLGYFRSSSPNISDSKGNSWTLVQKYEDPLSNAGVAIYYAWGSGIVVGSSHTFSTTSHFAGLFVLAVSGARSATTPLDQFNGTAVNSASNPLNTGSISPTATGTIVITGVYQNAADPAPTTPSGYTLMGAFAVGTSYPCGAAYKILSGSGAENPGWGVMAGDNGAAIVANFLVPATAASNNFSDLTSQTW